MAKQALEGKRINAFGMKPEDLVIVGIDTDHKKGEHPLWDKRIELELNEGMVKSMMMLGNTQAITVRKNGSLPEVVDGRQRVRCARVANERLVAAGKEPILVKVMAQRGQDLTMFGVMITSNEVRQSNTLMGKARLLETYLAMGGSDTQAAVAFGVTTTAIRQWKALLDLAPEIQEAVDTVQISASAAAELAPLERDEQVKQFQEAMEKAKATGGKVTTKATRQRRQQATNDPKATPYTAPRKPVVREVVAVLASEDNEVKFSDDALAVLKWTLGLAEASEVPGLEDALKAMEKVKEAAKASKGPKLTKPQKALLQKLADSEHLSSQLNSKTLNALITRGLAEKREGKDGLEYAHKVEATERDAAQASVDASNEEAA